MTCIWKKISGLSTNIVSWNISCLLLELWFKISADDILKYILPEIGFDISYKLSPFLGKIRNMSSLCRLLNLLREW